MGGGRGMPVMTPTGHTVCIAAVEMMFDLLGAREAIFIPTATRENMRFVHCYPDENAGCHPAN